jgi:hypothetical protein
MRSTVCLANVTAILWNRTRPSKISSRFRRKLFRVLESKRRNFSLQQDRQDKLEIVKIYGCINTLYSRQFIHLSETSLDTSQMLHRDDAIDLDSRKQRKFWLELC